MSDLYTIVVDKAALKYTMICSAALLFNCLFSNVRQGGARIKSGGRPPEDVSLFPAAGNQDFTGGSKSFKSEAQAKMYKEAELRAGRISMNDLENIPIALIINWGSLFCHANTTAHIALTITFAVSRILFTIAFANKKQPFRSIAWFGGVFSMLGLAINGVAGVLSL
jgi:glutathione S-transferase